MDQLFNGKNPSVMSHDFSKIPHADIGRSLFRRSSTHKTTFDAGILIPIYVDEVYPGDTFNMRTSVVARLSTPIVPLMDNLFLDFHFFFVPNRLVWDHWQAFMGEKTNPDDTTEYLVPTIDWNGETPAGLTIYDYLGLPTDLSSGSYDTVLVNALPLRCYNLIWNSWFRDQNLQDSVEVPKDDGPDDLAKYTLLRRGKRHDYFTSCLPWPQKGDAVDLPLGTWAPVIGRDSYVPFDTDTYAMRLRYSENGQLPAGDVRLNLSGGNLGRVYGADAATTGYNINTSMEPANLWADLSNATAATISSLREAFQLQRLLERDARGGTRYTEILHSHFGVQSPDARLQRPEYLGGGTAPVNIHSVPQNSNNTNDKTPIGTMSAYGFAAQSGIGFSKAFVEHGYIIGLVSARADLTYQTGLNKMWSRQTKYDFYWPSLAHLSEQEVLNREIYLQGNSDDSLVFGYQERWAELRYRPSMITGQMRSIVGTSLDVWHLSQDFTSLPILGDTFIQEDPPIDRVIAVSSQPHFIMDAYFDLKCARPMPLYSVPGLIDHF